MSAKLRVSIACIWLLGSLILSSCGGTTLAPTPQPTATPKPPSAPREVVLTLGSWRTDDVEQMNRILAQFTQAYPHITIKYVATNPPEYNAVLNAQLAGGSAPDLFYLRSYAVSRQLYEQGYLEPLDTLPGLQESFDPAMRAPWATDDGLPYGVPFIAVSHGIYYNVSLFRELGLAAPASWGELLATASIIQESGVTPFANASGDAWTMAEIVLMNLAPTFIGGRAGRMEYLSGQRCFNDAHMVAAFQAVGDLAPFLPENQALLTYADSLQLFLQGQAAMWLGGSWDISFFEQEQPTFEWSIFPVPPPAGQPGYVTFHLDAAIGLNAASPYKAEARQFLEWMTQTEFGAALGNELPGFFPLHRQAPTLANVYANTFLAFNQTHETDVRFTWEKLMEGTPSAYTLIQDGAIAVVSGAQTPQQAANVLQAGLEQWFLPAQQCK